MRGGGRKAGWSRCGLRAGLCCALLVWACGCGGGDKGLDGGGETEEPLPDAQTALVGEWVSEGTDPQYGPVGVLMRFEAGGDLRLVLLLESGGRLSFPGNWRLEDDTLVLQGAYFEGESRVRWTLAAGLLLLEAPDGRVQEWRRGDPATDPGASP